MIYSWGTVDMEPGTLFVATLDNAEKQNDGKFGITGEKTELK